MKNVPNKLKLLHFPQVPCEPFVVDVENEQQALFAHKLIADQHDFLFRNNIIPDYSNSIMLEMYDEDADGEGNGGWVDYYNADENLSWEDLVFCNGDPSKYFGQ